MASSKSWSCVVCGVAVWPSVKCCHPCRRSLSPDDKARLGVNKASTCLQCGKVSANRRSSYCTRQCFLAAQSRAMLTCQKCGKKYKPRNNNKMFCSRECNYAARASQRGASNKVFFPKCVQCGMVFTSRNANSKRCSYRCRVANSSARTVDLYRLACQLTPEGRGWRKMLIGYLRERDGELCQCGCRQRIRFDLSSGSKGHPSGLGPSIDHVIPRSQSGPDELSNLRLLTWKCNRLRGNRGGNEQLMLIG